MNLKEFFNETDGDWLQALQENMEDLANDLKNVNEEGAGITRKFYLAVAETIKEENEIRDIEWEIKKKKKELDDLNKKLNEKIERTR